MAIDSREQAAQMKKGQWVILKVSTKQLKGYVGKVLEIEPKKVTLQMLSGPLRGMVWEFASNLVRPAPVSLRWSTFWSGVRVKPQNI